MTKVEELIREVRDFAKWGQLANRDTIPVPDVLTIIEYLENPAKQNTHVRDKVAHLETQLSKERGQRGGLTKEINKLKKRIDDQDALKANNRKLSRIVEAAQDFVKHAEGFAEYGDNPWVELLEEPPYVRLREECK